VIDQPLEQIERPAASASASVLSRMLFNGEPLQGPDRNGLIQIAAPARGFARRPAHAAADRRQRIRSTGDQVSVFEAAFGNCAHVPARVGVNRAGLLTLDLFQPVAFIRRLDLEAIHADEGTSNGGFLRVARSRGHGNPYANSRPIARARPLRVFLVRRARKPYAT
jgi:hypothetical protein